MEKNQIQKKKDTKKSEEYTIMKSRMDPTKIHN